MSRVWVPPVVFAALLMGQAPPAGILAQEGPPPLIVREVGIQGNRRIQDALILGRVQTKVGAPVVTARVAEDVRAIFALGFFDDVQAKVEAFEGGIKLTFVVVERPLIRDIDLQGNRRVPTQTLQEKMAVKLGTVYNPVEVQKTRDTLKGHYEGEGFLEAEITPEAERLPDGDVKVVFRITEGRRFTIERIVIDGAKSLSERQVKAVMQTRERRFFIFGGILHRQDSGAGPRANSRPVPRPRPHPGPGRGP